MKSYDSLPIVLSMSSVRAELRTAVIAMVEVSWQERDGSLMDSHARVEDRSPSGACIRVKAPIRVGARVNVKWRWEEYQGIARYCRSDAGEYLLGIQRVTNSTPPNSLSSIRSRESWVNDARPLPAENIPASPGNNSVAPTELRGTSFEPVALLEISGVSVSATHDSAAPVSLEIQTQQASDGEERTLMSTKWLDSALKRQKQDAPNGKPNGAPPQDDLVRADAPPPNSNHANGGGKDPVRSQGDLQSMEDIYRSAGIMNPRMGYSIRKVVEMQNSDHLRGLSTDAKRAAVLMALDAAGITMDEILRDAKQRKDVLDTYEAGQRKQFEEYWARKAEGNAQIQTEMERVTAQCLGRIKRNQDEVSLEKAAFAEWQRTKEQETERISEAVELCSNVSPAEPSGAALVALRDMDPKAKPA